MKKLLTITLFLALLVLSFSFIQSAKAETCQEACKTKDYGAGMCLAKGCTTNKDYPNLISGETICAPMKGFDCCCKAKVAGTTGGTTGTTSGAAATGPQTLVDVSPVGDITGAAGVAKIIGKIINAFLGFIGAVALLMFVYGGFLMLVSGGRPEDINKGKNVLVWAVIGLIVVFMSYTLTKFVIDSLTKGVTSGGAGPSTPVTTAGTDCISDFKGECKEFCTSPPEKAQVSPAATGCDTAPNKTCCVTQTSQPPASPPAPSAPTTNCSSGEYCTSCDDILGCKDSRCTGFGSGYYLPSNTGTGPACTKVCCSPPQ